jgi:hypothetical protein
MAILNTNPGYSQDLKELKYGILASRTLWLTDLLTRGSNQ